MLSDKGNNLASLKFNIAYDKVTGDCEVTVACKENTLPSRLQRRACKIPNLSTVVTSLAMDIREWEENIEREDYLEELRGMGHGVLYCEKCNQGFLKSNAKLVTFGTTTYVACPYCRSIPGVTQVNPNTI